MMCIHKPFSGMCIQVEQRVRSMQEHTPKPCPLLLVHFGESELPFPGMSAMHFDISPEELCSYYELA